MSDIEHELVLENQALRDDLRRVGELAARALHAAIDAQHAATGEHEPWLDDALRELGSRAVREHGAVGAGDDPTATGRG